MGLGIVTLVHLPCGFSGSVPLCNPNHNDSPVLGLTSTSASEPFNYDGMVFYDSLTIKPRSDSFLRSTDVRLAL
jgi:hypothetical protein